MFGNRLNPENEKLDETLLEPSPSGSAAQVYAAMGVYDADLKTPDYETHGIDQEQTTFSEYDEEE